MPSGWVKNGSRWIALVALPLMLLSAVAFAQEVEVGGKVRSGDEVVVPADQTVPSDLYVSGGTVRIEGRVEGDLVAAGGQVDISGPVTGDVLVAAGTTTVSGEVGGDVRVGTGQLLVGGSVGEDLIAGAGRVTVASQARVGEDLIFSTGQTILAGTVAGDVLGATGNYVKQGSVAGTETVKVREPAEKRPPTVGQRVLDFLRRYVSILIVGALLLWLAPRALRAGADGVRGRPLPSLGVGILGIVGFALLVLAVILVTVLVAVMLGLLGFGFLGGTTVFGGIVAEGVIAFLFFLAVAFGAQAAVGIALGRLLVKERDRSFPRAFGALVLGVLVVVLLSSIPLVGGLLELLLVLLGLGALILAVLSGRRRARAEQAG